MSIPELAASSSVVAMLQLQFGIVPNAYRQ
jgi:hypothetical protein